MGEGGDTQVLLTDNKGSAYTDIMPDEEDG